MLDSNEIDQMPVRENLSDFQKAGWRMMFGNEESVDIPALKSEFLNKVTEMGITVDQFVSPFEKIARAVWGEDGRSASIADDETLTISINGEDFVIQNSRTRSTADSPLADNPNLKDFSRTTQGAITAIKSDGSELDFSPMIVHLGKGKAVFPLRSFDLKTKEGNYLDNVDYSDIASFFEMKSIAD